MSEHDPIADPLTPFWREKVERAFREIPTPPARQRLPQPLRNTERREDHPE